MAGMVVFCAGCSMRRVTSDTVRYGSEEHVESEELESTGDIRLTASSTVRERWKGLRITLREFDLDRKPDKDGRYPVKSETTLEGQEHENEKKQEAEELESQARRKKTGNSDNSLLAGQSRGSELDTKMGENALWWWVTGIVTAILGIIFLGRKYGKKNQTK